MKTHLSLRTYGLAALAALSLALAPALRAQTINSTTTTATPANPTGSEETSKPANDSMAQQRTAGQDTNPSQTTMSTTPTPANPSGSEETTKPNNDSVAQQRTAGQDANQTQTTSPSQDVPDNANRHTVQDTAPHTSAPSPGYSDRHFLAHAAEGGLTEVRLGQLAQQNGGSEQVKQFGARMVSDHSQANTELQALAQQKDIAVPSKLDPRHQATVDQLSKLTGPAFDRAYVDDMVKDHQRTVSEFEHTSATTQDPGVKAFTDKTLPVIKSHLSEAQSLQSSLK